MRRIVLVVLPILAAMCLLAIPSYAQGVPSFDVGYLVGGTEYQIDFTVLGETARSLLEWPIRNNLVGLSYAWPGEMLGICANIWTQVSQQPGTMKDSDWISGDAHEGLDIYSTSTCTLNSATLWDIQGIVNGLRRDFGSLSIAPVLGYQSRYLDFTASNAWQSAYEFEPIFMPGAVCNYHVTYGIPYLGLHSTQSNERLRATFDLLYSPIAKGADFDDHLQREDWVPDVGDYAEGKRSEGTTSGTAFLASGSVAFSVRENLNLKGRLSYLSITTRGSQTQYYYFADGTTYPILPDTFIGLILRSIQTLASLELEYRF